MARIAIATGKYLVYIPYGTVWYRTVSYRKEHHHVRYLCSDVPVPVQVYLDAATLNMNGHRFVWPAIINYFRVDSRTRPVVVCVQLFNCSVLLMCPLYLGAPLQHPSSPAWKYLLLLVSLPRQPGGPRVSSSSLRPSPSIIHTVFATRRPPAHLHLRRTLPDRLFSYPTTQYPCPSGPWHLFNSDIYPRCPFAPI